MEEDVKGIFDFKGIGVCNVRETLEPSICRKIFEARNVIVDSLRDTRHRNRDTQKLRRIIDDLDFIVKANTKVDGTLLLFKKKEYSD